MEHLRAIPLRLVYIHTKWCSHLTEGHIVLKGLCLLFLVRASLISSELISLLLAVAVIQRRQKRHVFYSCCNHTQLYFNAFQLSTKCTFRIK